VSTIQTLAGLDFNDAKAAIKTFLRSQSIFRDYDWDGSNMSVLVGALAYNQFLYNFYLNMVSSEGRLSSARLLDSVVATAKPLGYVPRSPRSAVASLDLSVPTTGAQSLTLPKNTQFSSQNANGTYTFCTRSSGVYYSSSNTFLVSNLEVFEGSYVTDAYVFDSTDELQRFTLESNSADTDSLSVSVATPSGSNVASWKLATNLYGLDETSNVYFVQGAEGGKFEVVFGDGVFGRRPDDGSVVTLEYMVTEGANGNGCDTFVMDDDLGQINGTTILSPFVIETTGVSAGGDERETVESIKFRAPRHYQTQEAAITASDYASMVLKNFSDVAGCFAYGGETVSGSVQYGRTFVAVVGRNGAPIIDARKEEIKAFLESRSGMNMEAVMISPETTYLGLNVSLHVDSSKLVGTLAQLEGAVSKALTKYNASSLGRFNKHFLDSRVTDVIQAVDAAIDSVELSTTISKLADMGLNEPKTVTLEFKNAIAKGVRSSHFTYLGKRYVLTDTLSSRSPNGALYKLEVNPLYSSDSYSTVGTINYSTGTIDVSTIEASSFVGDVGLRFFATPVADNVYAKKNEVLKIDLSRSVISSSTSY